MVYKICLIATCFGAVCNPIFLAKASEIATPIGAIVSQAAQGGTKMSNSISTAANTARDGQIAIKEEFDAAMKSNTKPALELFIKRHPNSPWTPTAKAQLIALARSKR